MVLSGTYALRGRDPKKILVGVAEVIDWVQRMEGRGVISKGVAIDWPALMRFKRTFTDGAHGAGHLDEAIFDQISNINFKGAFFTVQRALPYFSDDGSVILVTGSVHEKGGPGYSVVSETKAAVRLVVRTFSAELLPRGVRVNALSPESIETPIFDKRGLPVEPEKWAEKIPTKRIGRAEEMAKAALFLASDDSSYFAGAELVADGGKTEI